MMMVSGIDVSKWQGEVDWAAVGGAGHRFAFCKATEGVGYVDPRFRENWSGIEKAGLYRGAYHFARASKSPTLEDDALAEADHFLHTIGRLGSGDFAPVLDIEWDKRAKGLGPDDIVRWCRVFLERIETMTARLPIVYTGPSFWRYRLGRSEFFSRYPLWEADYRKSSFQKRKPKTIPGWAATFWQYTGKGTSPGVDGRVDLNYFLGTAYDLERVAYVGRARPKIAAATPAKPPSRSVVWDALVAKMLERWFGTSSRSASRVV